MSKSALRKQISKELLKNFERQSEKTVGKASRILLQSSEVNQCIVLKQTQTRAIQTGYEAAIGRELTKSEGTKYRAAVKNFIKGKSAPFPAQKTQQTKFFMQLVAKNKLTFGKSIFYVPASFDTIKSQISSFNEKYTEKSDRNDEYDRDKFGATTHMDHGADGTASGLVGAVVGAFSVKQKSRRQNVPKNFKKKFESNLTAVFDSGLNELTRGQKGRIKQTLMELVTLSEQIIAKGGDLKAGLSMILTPILAKENIVRGSTEEKLVQEIFLKAFEMTFTGVDLANLEGSSTLNQKIEKFIVIDSLVKNLKAKGLKVKVKTKAGNVKTKTSTRVKDKGRGGKGHAVGRINRGGAFASAPTARRQEAGSSARRSMFSIMAMINEKLPRVVEKNMRRPALESRSGAFARSTRLTDVNITPKGFPSFGYTYDKNPYEVFEVGRGASPWATPDRDPRKIIDASIREIAGTMALGRFFTRRV